MQHFRSPAAFHIISGNYKTFNLSTRPEFHDRDWDYGFLVCGRASLPGFIAFVKNWGVAKSCRESYVGCEFGHNEPPPTGPFFPTYSRVLPPNKSFCDKSSPPSCHLFAAVLPTRFCTLDLQSIFLVKNK